MATSSDVRSTVVRSTVVQQADSFMSDLHRARSSAPSQESVAFSPPCHLRLEGGEASEATCEILELSAEGVNIAITGGSSVRQGQHGRLLIGPPEGDHYELPVDVSWVQPAASIAVLGLNLRTPPNWRLART
ncbi:MAG: hypothetical protein ACKOYK_11735 [Cyanobium sp.]